MGVCSTLLLEVIGMGTADNNEALKRAHEDPDTGPPKRPFDLD